MLDWLFAPPVRRPVEHRSTLQSGFGIAGTVRQCLVRVEHPRPEAEQPGVGTRRVLFDAQILLLQRPLASESSKRETPAGYRVATVW